MKVSFDNLGHVLFKLLVLLILFVFLLNFKVSINVNYRDLSMNNKICQRFFKIIENEYRFARSDPDKYLYDIVSMNRYLSCNFNLKKILSTLKERKFLNADIRFE